MKVAKRSYFRCWWLTGDPSACKWTQQHRNAMKVDVFMLQTLSDIYDLCALSIRERQNRKLFWPPKSQWLACSVYFDTFLSPWVNLRFTKSSVEGGFNYESRGNLCFFFRKGHHLVSCWNCCTTYSSEQWSPITSTRPPVITAKSP